MATLSVILRFGLFRFSEDAQRRGFPFSIRNFMAGTGDLFSNGQVVKNGGLSGFLDLGLRSDLDGGFLGPFQGDRFVLLIQAGDRANEGQMLGFRFGFRRGRGRFGVGWLRAEGGG